MTGQRWRTYALLLHFYATFNAATWLIDRLGNPWGYVGATFMLGICLVGLIVPVTQDPAARHRRDEAA